MRKLPDYVIYDRLQQERQEREADAERPRVYVPDYLDYPDYPEEHEADEEPSERGVIIIQM